MKLAPALKSSVLLVASSLLLAAACGPTREDGDKQDGSGGNGADLDADADADAGTGGAGGDVSGDGPGRYDESQWDEAVFG